ncbi:methenyltetrahydromethanopterin cyclohydrolase [Candidatus Bathyarchaeota archaeon]|nr:methenyltetrahydromethanopterin cyclohydrolase [Candidatus Bathyarchaeota archaeon]
MNKIKVNELSLRIVKKILDHPKKLSIEVSKLENGATIIDMGVHARGGFEAGRLATEICLGGLANAQLAMMTFADITLPAIGVTTSWPAISTLGIQAGYPLLEGEKTKLIASGPARALALKPRKLFDFLDFMDESNIAVIVLQMDYLPSEQVAELIAAECNIESKDLYILVTPGESLAGATQIAGRAIEDVTFTMREVLHYDVRKVKHMFGLAPIAPVCKFVKVEKALSDDLICYCGKVFVALESKKGEDLENLAEELVFESTPIYGKTFYDVLKEANFDFRKVPGFPSIFRPAQVIINDLRTGKMYKAGDVNLDMIKKCLRVIEGGTRI